MLQLRMSHSVKSIGHLTGSVVWRPFSYVSCNFLFSTISPFFFFFNSFRFISGSKSASQCPTQQQRKTLMKGNLTVLLDYFILSYSLFEWCSLRYWLVAFTACFYFKQAVKLHFAFSNALNVPACMANTKYRHQHHILHCLYYCITAMMMLFNLPSSLLHFDLCKCVKCLIFLLIFTHIL